jgi:4-aminobutyrate aminotransferase-like enzyme
MEAEVLELSPPLTISEEDLDRGIAAVREAVS